MKSNLRIVFYPLLILSGIMIACSQKEDTSNGSSGDREVSNGHHSENAGVHLSDAQFKALDVIVDSLRKKYISISVQASGQLEVPPQNEAAVTAVIGANITSIKVIEGEQVKKGQVLAYLTHPNLTQLQVDYHDAWSKYQFLVHEFQRQEKLYDAQVGSGKEFQQTRSEYLFARGRVNGLQAQMRQLGMSAERIKDG